MPPCQPGEFYEYQDSAAVLAGMLLPAETLRQEPTIGAAFMTQTVTLSSEASGRHGNVMLRASCRLDRWSNLRSGILLDRTFVPDDGVCALGGQGQLDGFCRKQAGALQEPCSNAKSSDALVLSLPASNLNDNSSSGTTVVLQLLSLSLTSLRRNLPHDSKGAHHSTSWLLHLWRNPSMRPKPGFPSSRTWSQSCYLFVP